MVATDAPHERLVLEHGPHAVAQLLEHPQEPLQHEFVVYAGAPLQPVNLDFEELQALAERE